MQVRWPWSERTLERVAAAVGAVVALALCIALTGCQPQRDSEWTRVGEPLPRWEEVVAAVRLVAPCDPDPWGGIIDVRYRPFPCGDACASGCMDEPGRVTVMSYPDAWQSALAHELCHDVYVTCRDDYYETTAEACAARAKAP